MNYLLENATDEQFERFFRNFNNDHMLRSWGRPRAGFDIELINGSVDRYVSERFCIACSSPHPGPSPECPSCNTYLPSLLLEEGRPWAYWTRYTRITKDNGAIVVSKGVLEAKSDGELYEWSSRIAEYMPGSILKITDTKPE